MADPKILYNNLFSNKLYSKSYDDFLEQYDNEEGVKKLHNKLSQNSLYSKDFDAFKEQYKLGKLNDLVQGADAGSENGDSAPTKLESQEDKDFKYFENIRTKKTDAITPSDFTEEKVQPELHKRFGKYGFVFEETGLGDRIKVSTTDPNNPITKTFPIKKRD